MRGLLRAYLGLSHFFGSSLRFWRRLAALSLVVLGVHAAADHIDDLVFAAVDTLDLWLDQFVWAVCDWLASMGGMSKAEAVQKAQGFAEWIDLEEKDKFSLVLALGFEVVIDLMLFDWVWGNRRAVTDETVPVGMVAEFKESVAELKAAMWPLNLQRLSVPLVLLLFSLAGAFSAALAIESAISSTLGSVAPLWRWGINAAAAGALLSVAILAWRFIPDLIHGGILQVQQRQAAREEKERLKEADDEVPSTRLAAVRRFLRRVTRGLFSTAVLLPLAVLGLASQNAFVQLVARTGANL